MKKACVIGWPISHSRSPLIHNYWIKRYGIDAHYDKQAVAPEDLTQFIARLRDGEFLGCNVTIPHKERIMSLVDMVDKAAQNIKAANTLYVRDGQLHATNTDGAGLIASLSLATPELCLKGAEIVLIGAGGAARAVIQALLAAGVERISLFNRTAERITVLREDFGPTIGPSTLSDLSTCDLLVNSTSLGMQGNGEVVIDVSLLPDRCVVADLVYVPFETALLSQARARGLRHLNGLGMLLHQAVGGFELWFGIRPEVTEALVQLVKSDILEAHHL